MAGEREDEDILLPERREAHNIAVCIEQFRIRRWVIEFQVKLLSHNILFCIKNPRPFRRGFEGLILVFYQIAQILQRFCNE